MTTYQVPALIDCHVHFREPGLEHKADMATECLAAFHGGIRTACEMPNTNPPTNSIVALADKVKRADRARHHCDLRFYFGATTDEHLAQLKALWSEPEHAELKRHCCGLKLYLDNSTGDMKADDTVVDHAFELCGALSIPLVAHCECSCINNAAAEAVPPSTVAAHSQRRPESSEVKSIREAITRAEKYGTQFHVAHLSTGGGLELVQAAKRKGNVRVTCEVTPHHLFLTTADYPEMQSRIKVNPPIRELQNDVLWRGLLDGSIDCVATDHAPHTLEEKALGATAPSGMPGVEVVVLLLTSIAAGHWPHPTATPPPAVAEALQNRTLTLQGIERLMFTAPNAIFRLGVSSEKAIELTTEGGRVITNEDMHSKCGWTPYHGWAVKGGWNWIDQQSKA